METATRTGRVVGDFGQQLDGLSGALAEPDARLLGEQISLAQAGTKATRNSIQALQDQVVQSRSEIDKLRAELLRSREEASRCSLTGVFNRRGFEQRMHEMLRIPPAKGGSHCLIMFDIDHFKRVNDTYGHAVGDRVIVGLGEVLRSLPPQPGMACARYGGDEFAIVLPSTTLKTAARVAEAVRARMQGLRVRNRAAKEVQFTVTISAGVAAWQPGEDIRALVSCADAALYRSKANGRNRVTVA
jgi:diguanylate cyclase